MTLKRMWARLSTRRRRWLVLLAPTLLALVIGGVVHLTSAQAPVPAAGTEVAPQSRAPDGGAPIGIGSAASSLVASPVAQGLTADADAVLAQRMKADWCGFGAAERDRQRRAVEDGGIALRGSIDMQALTDVHQTVGAQVMAQAVADARRRWVEALIRRGDERSLAIADYVDGGETDGDASASASAGARARLQLRARTSTDPMVTALALQRPCADGACVNIDAAQWARLEPGNLDAWLALMNSPSPSSRSSQTAYGLDRLAHEARYSRNYRREMYGVLMSLPQTPVPGLDNEAETELASNLLFAWPLFQMRPLLELCRSGATDAGTTSRCEAAARLMLQQEDWLYRAMGMGIARALVTARPGVRPQWEAAAQAYEAVQEWDHGKSARAASAPDGQLDLSSYCAQLVVVRKILHDAMTRGEWEVRREGLSESGLSEATLSARWRQREGRSVLDPIRAPQPASAPARPG